MTQERWEEIKGKLLDTFEGCREGTEEENVEHIEWVEFENHEGTRMRLEWHDSPKKLGEKTITSKRIGADVAIEPEYSDSERIQRIALFVWNEGEQDWIEGDASSFV